MNAPARTSFGAILKGTLTLNFAGLDEVPLDDPRVGLAFMIVGAPLIGVGVALLLWLMRVTGLPMNMLFAAVAVIGVLFFAHGTYAAASAFFPSLRNRTKLASLARMLIFFVALGALATVLLFVFATTR